MNNVPPRSIIFALPFTFHFVSERSSAYTAIWTLNINGNL